MKTGMLFTLACACMICAAATTQAQTEASLYLRSGGNLKGQILEVRDDSLTFESKRMLHDAEFSVVKTVHRFHRDDVLRIEFTESGFFKRMAIGTLTGTVLGAGIGAVSTLYVNPDGHFAPFEQIGRFLLGTIGGTIIGFILEMSYAVPTQTFYPSLDQDYNILRSRFEAGESETDAEVIIPSSLSYVLDSLPLVTVQGKDDNSQTCYLREIQESGIVILPDDLHSLMQVAFDTSIFIPFTAIRFITNDDNSGWETGVLVGALLAPMIFGAEDGNSFRLPGIIAAGALVGGALTYWYANRTTDVWKWHPGAGDPDFLRAYSLDGRFTQVPLSSPAASPK
jgi:hypothetical protein